MSLPEKEAADGGAQLPLFVANKNIKQFVSNDLSAVLTNPIWYIPEGSGNKNKGVKAELIPKILDVTQVFFAGSDSNSWPRLRTLS